MRLAVISDIHGNLEALRRVLDDFPGQGVDAAVCLGDIIGYGPDPQAVARIIRERGIPSVVGNHEQALASRRHRNWFNPVARKTLGVTASLLSPETAAWLGALPPTLLAHGCLFVHGCPPDSARTYLFEVEDEDLARRMAAMPAPLCFVGHTHELALASCLDGLVTRHELAEGCRELPPHARHIVNAGSVGQPRDPDSRAKYVVWDSLARRLTVRCLAYDAQTTADKILALGLPEQYARRLL